MLIEVIDHAGAESPAVPASTVVLVRAAEHGIEVLLMHRGAGTAFGGMWAFPGGRIEEGDVPAGTAPDPLPAARRAAAREAAEEVGLVIDESSLVWWSHWLPPLVAPRRFSTWFFVAPADACHGAIAVDGNEAVDHRWLAPTDALGAQARGEMELAPPTFVTLEQLRRYDTVDEVLLAAEPVHFATQMTVDTAGNRYCLWAGDASYGRDLVTGDGPHHRLLMVAGAWRYVRTAPIA